MASLKQLDPTAVQHELDTQKEIRISLLRIANELAQRDGIPAIQITHINEARQRLAPAKGKQNRKELAKYIGGICLGAALPGLYQALHDVTPTKPVDNVTLVFYIILFGVSIGLTVYGFLE